MERIHHLKVRHGSLALPVFLPDATYGVVRALDSQDLEECGVLAVMMNVFHLMRQLGSPIIRSLGGLHQMSDWHRPIITDSGGFQSYSLIRENKRYGSISDGGILFRPDGARKKVILTPEKVVQLQVGYGADVLFCLDQCTHVSDSMAEQELSVTRTIKWARRCRAEYERLQEGRGEDGGQRPLIFAVIQGGGSRELRQRCAEELLQIGFDGFGFGGWPLDQDNNLLEDMIAYTRSLIPAQIPFHALGIGHPAHVTKAAQLGCDIIDSSMPTRDARHGRLYCFSNEENSDCYKSSIDTDFHFCYILDERYAGERNPLSPVCRQRCCRSYSSGYLHHLAKQSDPLYLRLATMHNLSFMMELMDRVRRKHYGE